MRIILPPVLLSSIPMLGNQMVQIIKDSAFLVIIAVQELTFAANEIQATYYVPFASFVCAMLLYWLLCLGGRGGRAGGADHGRGAAMKRRTQWRRTLTDAQVTHFREQGWLAPLRAMDAAQAADCAARIAAYEAKMGESANRSLKIKGHLAMPWLVELGRSPTILDALEDLIGPDILLFGASIFAKGGKDRAYVSWHQDSAYFGLDPHEEITAWVAFTQTTAENGALQVLPRTHLGPDLVHEETYAPDNMLARGQIAAASTTKAAPSPSSSSPASSRCTTSAPRTARSRTAPPPRASASRFSIFRRTCAPPSAAAPPRWCAASTVTAIGMPTRCRGSISTRWPSTRCAPPGASIATERSSRPQKRERRFRPSSHRSVQILQGPSGAGGHRPLGVGGRDGLHPRSLGRRQIDTAALHQLAGGAR